MANYISKLWSLFTAPAHWKPLAVLFKMHSEFIVFVTGIDAERLKHSLCRPYGRIQLDSFLNALVNDEPRRMLKSFEGFSWASLRVCLLCRALNGAIKKRRTALLYACNVRALEFYCCSRNFGKMWEKKVASDLKVFSGRKLLWSDVQEFRGSGALKDGIRCCFGDVRVWENLISLKWSMPYACLFIKWKFSKQFFFSQSAQLMLRG